MDDLRKEPRLMRVQYLHLVDHRARIHEDGRSMAGDHGPKIEDDERYGKLREERRARRRLRRSPTRAARAQASEASGGEELS
jgi:hypothetical protein